MQITDVEKVVVITNEELFQFINEKSGQNITSDYSITDIECDSNLEGDDCVRITLQK